jgi:hypothetical protein
MIFRAKIPSALKRSKRTSIIIIVSALFALPFAQPTVSADIENGSGNRRISLERLNPPQGYGYRLQYVVPVPIEVFWKFKTDFDNEILLTSSELVGHRLVEVNGRDVITEDQYASAPGLKFLWKTTILKNAYRMEFILLNPEQCRHDFHYGSIQLRQVGERTHVTQTAFFDFKGASIWVKYPWYGGMKSTLTKVAKWEQKTAERYRRLYVAGISD